MNIRPLAHSLRLKVTLGVVLPLVLILGIFTAIEYLRQREIMLANLSSLASYSGQVIESSLRHAMLESDFDEVQASLNTVGESEEIRVVYLLDTSGEVMFSSDGANVGTRLDNHQPDCQPCHHLPREARPNSVVVTTQDGERVFRSMQPIENEPACAECHGSEERLRGLLLVDIPVAAMQSSLASHLRDHLLWWASATLVTVLVANLALNRLVLHRLEGLATAITDLGRGKSYSPLYNSQPDEIGQLTQAFNRMVNQVETRSAEKANLLRRLMSAQEDERKRIARELHDGTSQALTSLLVGLDTVRTACVRVNGDPSIIRRLEELRQIVLQALEEVHDMALQLRPSALDDLGLAAALERLVADCRQRYDVDMHLTTHGFTEGRLQAPIETELYRIVQEALTNVMRHAQAQTAGIVVERRDRTVRVIIEDDGCGFDPNIVADKNNRRLGLIGIRERAELLGGSVTIESGPQTGTTLFVEIPTVLNAEESGHFPPVGRPDAGQNRDDPYSAGR